MTEEEIVLELASMKRELGDLRLKVRQHDEKLRELPETMLLSKSLVARSFAVLGHAVFVYLLLILLFVLLRLLL